MRENTDKQGAGVVLVPSFNGRRKQTDQQKKGPIVPISGKVVSIKKKTTTQTEEWS